MESFTDMKSKSVLPREPSNTETWSEQKSPSSCTPMNHGAFYDIAASGARMNKQRRPFVLGTRSNQYLVRIRRGRSGGSGGKRDDDKRKVCEMFTPLGNGMTTNIISYIAAHHVATRAIFSLLLPQA
ncbi:hypothetical protein CBL_03996 [Carabus blaptoides fortunei]